MKTIRLYQRQAGELVLHDEDDKPFDQYVDNLSSLLGLQNISILSTSSKNTKDSVIIRPTDIISIRVTEETGDDVVQKVELKIEEPRQSEEKKDEKKEQIDIITDL